MSWSSTLKPGTDPYAFVQELREHGAFVTASSDQNGVPDGEHTYLKAFSMFPLRVTFPNETGPMVAKPEVVNNQQ